MWMDIRGGADVLSAVILIRVLTSTPSTRRRALEADIGHQGLSCTTPEMARVPPNLEDIDCESSRSLYPS